MLCLLVCLWDMWSDWLVFFFKQKTAYEMRISDWSSTCALPIFDSERPLATSPQTLAGEEAISVDVAGSYLLTRNIALKAGVRYHGPANRLAPLTDERQ